MTTNQFANALKAQPTKAPEKPRSPEKERVKRKHIGGYFAPEVSRRLKMLSSEEETTVQELLTEALNLLFQSRGKSLI